MLNLQIQTFKETNQPLKELTPILFQNIQEFSKVKIATIKIRSFQKVNEKTLRLDLHKDAAPFELIAVITVQDGYPEKPCLFDLSLGPVVSLKDKKDQQ